MKKYKKNKNEKCRQPWKGGNKGEKKVGGRECHKCFSKAKLKLIGGYPST